MAEYVAVFKPGEDVTFTASAAVTGGQLVALTAAGAVAPTSGSTAAWMGVATTDAPTGAKVGVTSGGVQEVTASAAVAAGDVLIPAAAGRLAPIGAGTNYAQVVGVALTAAAAAGAPFRARFTR
jgi:hypothetical protein